MEPDGLAGDPRRELACDPYRELDPLCIAALFACGAWTLAGAQTRDRILWRTCGDEGDARRGTVGALRSWHCAGDPECHNGNAARRPCGRSGARGTRPLQSSNGALEIRRLGGFRHRARRDARAFGRYEPTNGWPLVTPSKRLSGNIIVRKSWWRTNASLFHVPSRELPRVLLKLSETLRPRGVLFCSNPRGNNEEGFGDGRYSCFFDLDTWRNYVRAAGFFEVGHYYRPPGLPRHQQPWLATVWRKG